MPSLALNTYGGPGSRTMEPIQASDLEALRQALLARGAKRCARHYVSPFDDAGPVGEWFPVEQLSEEHFVWATTESAGLPGIVYSTDAA